MGLSKDSLIGFSEEAISRTRRRMSGLTDDEYAWTPVDDCLTAGSDGHGGFRFEETPMGNTPAGDDAAPFTTLAWRMWHLMGNYAEARNPVWLGLEPAPNPMDDLGARPVDAACALALLHRCTDTWQGYLRAVSQDALDTPMGPKAGPYATSTGADLVLHQIDEQVHHGAECGLLRDLYRELVAAPRDPLAVRLMRGDAAASEDQAAVERLRSASPGLVTIAAERGRWDGVRLLAELGFDVDNPGGRSAVHLAAGAGDIETVELLVAKAADLTATDPEFSATPRGWAEFFGHHETAARIKELEG